MQQFVVHVPTPVQLPNSSVPSGGVPSVTFAHVTVPHAVVNVYGRQALPEFPEHTSMHTGGAVRRQMFTVTVPVEVQAGTPGAVTVYVKLAVLPVLPVAL